VEQTPGAKPIQLVISARTLATGYIQAR